jgi:hypothetical protein
MFHVEQPHPAVLTSLRAPGRAVRDSWTPMPHGPMQEASTPDDAPAQDVTARRPGDSATRRLGGPATRWPAYGPHRPCRTGPPLIASLCETGPWSGTAARGGDHDRARTSQPDRGRCHPRPQRREWAQHRRRDALPTPTSDAPAGPPTRRELGSPAADLPALPAHAGPRSTDVRSTSPAGSFAHPPGPVAGRDCVSAHRSFQVPRPPHSGKQPIPPAVPTDGVPPLHLRTHASALEQGTYPAESSQPDRHASLGPPPPRAVAAGVAAPFRAFGVS